MSKNPSAPQFEGAMRGYDRNSVHTAVANLASERDAAQKRADDLERELAALRLAKSKDGRGKAYLSMLRRVEMMLLAAGEEADVFETTAADVAKALRDEVTAEVEKMRVQDEQQTDALLAKANADGAAMIAEAQAEAQAMIAEATKTANAKIATAAEEVEVARAEGVRLAVEFENALTTEREQFEADVKVRQEAAEADLEAAGDEMEHTKAETAALPENMRRAAQALIDASRAGAVEIIAQAKTRADFFRQEIERELVALTARRDANNAALSNTGGTLTGLSSTAAITASHELGDGAEDAIADLPAADNAAGNDDDAAPPAAEVPVPAGMPSFPQPTRGRMARKGGVPVPHTDEATQGAQDKS